MPNRYTTAATVLRTAADQRTRAARRAAGELTEELRDGTTRDERPGSVAIFRMLAEADELVIVADELDTQADAVTVDLAAAAAAPRTGDLADDATDEELKAAPAKGLVAWVTAHPEHAGRVRTLERARATMRITVVNVLDAIAPETKTAPPADADARTKAAEQADAVVAAIDRDPSLNAAEALDAAAAHADEAAADVPSPDELGAVDEDEPTDEELAEAELGRALAPTDEELAAMSDDELAGIAAGDIGATTGRPDSPIAGTGTVPDELRARAATVLDERAATEALA